MAYCKHGIQEASCCTCRENKMQRPLILKPFFLKSEGILGLIIDTPSEAGQIEVFLATEPGKILKVDGKSINAFTEEELTDEQRKDLLNAALTTGFLFIPEAPLTYHETIDDLKCWSCKKPVGFDKGSFGCVKVEKDRHHYVCTCGACLCVRPQLMTFQRYLLEERENLPCDKIERQQFIRIAKALIRE